MLSYSYKKLIKIYEIMLKIRVFQEKIVEVYPQQKMRTPVHLYIGEEAVATGVCINLRKYDYVFSYHRCHGHFIAKGTELKSIMAELFGKIEGCSGGKGGSPHLVDVKNKILGTSAIVAGTIPIAVGVALALSMKNKKSVVVSFFGDGAMEAGVTYESLNFASLKKLPIVFICENNFYATQTPLYKRQCADNIYLRVKPFLIPAERIDGNNVLDVFRVAKEAIQRARKGLGPSFIEARTYRFKEHVGPYDDTHLGYRTREELNYWMKRDPIKQFRRYLLENRIIAVKKIKLLEDSVKKEIMQAYYFGKRGIYPQEKDLFKDVY